MGSQGGCSNSKCHLIIKGLLEHIELVLVAGHCWTKQPHPGSHERLEERHSCCQGQLICANAAEFFAISLSKMEIARPSASIDSTNSLSLATKSAHSCP